MHDLYICGSSNRTLTRPRRLDVAAKDEERLYTRMAGQDSRITYPKCTLRIWDTVSESVVKIVPQPFHVHLKSCKEIKGARIRD